MITEYLLAQEVECVLAALMPANRLVCQVCLYTGLRVNDVLSFKTEEVNQSFWIIEGKTGKKRLVSLSDALVSKIRDQAGSIYAFPHRLRTDAHRTRQAIWKDVKRASKAFRMPQNVSVHSFRKVYAVDLLKKYGDLERVRCSLNHGSLTTTLIYAMADKLLQAKKSG